MMTIQSSIINGEVDLKAKSTELIAAKVSKTGLLVPSIQVEQGTKPSMTPSAAPALLLELVTIVSQIAQLDAMFEKVKKNAPAADSDANKWHEVSVQALETSRKYMVEQQTSLIQRLANVTGTTTPVQSGNVALDPPKATVAPDSRKEDDRMAETPLACPPGLAPPPGLDTPPGLDMPAQNAAQVNSEKSAKPAISGEGNSLRTDLEKIKLYAPGCALLVRKIKPLGFESADHLKTHFSQFGEVKEVLVSHCITKPSPKRASGRVRPAALGFVVMATPEEADEAFAQAEHLIQSSNESVNVEVTRFRDGSDSSEELL